MYYGDNELSSIFTKRIKSHEEHNAPEICGQRITFDTHFVSDSKFVELRLVVTKSGNMTWFVPNRNNPTLSCHHSSLANIKYISFSGYSWYDVDYKIGCNKNIRMYLVYFFNRRRNQSLPKPNKCLVHYV